MEFLKYIEAYCEYMWFRPCSYDAEDSGSSWGRIWPTALDGKNPVTFLIKKSLSRLNPVGTIHVRCIFLRLGHFDGEHE